MKSKRFYFFDTSLMTGENLPYNPNYFLRSRKERLKIRRDVFLYKVIKHFAYRWRG